MLLNKLNLLTDSEAAATAEVTTTQPRQLRAGNPGNFAHTWQTFVEDLRVWPAQQHLLLLPCRLPLPGLRFLPHLSL